MGVRYEFQRSFDHTYLVFPDLAIRRPTRADMPLLTGLYLQSFQNTVDEEPLMSREIPNYFAGKYGPPDLKKSNVIFAGTELVAACLISEVEEPGWGECPSVTFLMVKPSFRRRGLASHLLGEAITELHYHACTYITPGNHPSEAIFTKFGFVRVRS